MMRVGVVGVGNMGGAMAARLLELGWRVTVRDVLATAEEALRTAGAGVAASPAAVAARSDAVIVAVVDAAQTEAVLFGADGIASASPRPGCVLLCPTIAPGDVERFAVRLGGAGIDAIDAPMSGGPLRARAGRMSLMVACADTVFERHRALLETLAWPLHRLGERLGDGARTKLVNNLLAAVNLAGATEALALAERLGLDVARTLEVIEHSSGQSWIGSDRMRRLLAGERLPLAHVGLLAKDSRLALEMARAVEHAAPLGEAAARRFALACEQGLAAADDASLFGLARGGER